MTKIIVPKSDLIKPSRRAFLLGLGASIAAPSIVRAQALGSIGFLTRGQAKPYNSVPRINLSHPAAESIATYCYDIGGSILDLVNGTQITVVNGTPPFGSQQAPFGRGLQFAIDSYAFLPPLSPSLLKGLGQAAPYSAAMGTFYTGFPGPLKAGNTDLDMATATVQDASNNTNTAFGFNSWDSTSPAPNKMSCIFANTYDVFFTPTITPSAFQSWAVSCPTTSVANLYSAGVFDNQSTDGRGTVSSAVTAPQIMYNTASINAGQDRFGHGINGFAPYFGMWARARSANEFLLQHQDPYRMSAGDQLPFLIYPEDEMLAMLVGGASAGVVGKWNKF